MRKEYITYEKDIPVNINYATIMEYPFHWHNSTEILFVLNGKIKVTIGSKTYELNEREIEIINVDEAHRIFSNDKENKILIFHFDSSFFEKYYTDFENMFFYTNSQDKYAQETEEYIELRNYLSIILCEVIQKKEDYDEEIERTMIDLLYHLINNYHYLMYDNEEFKEKGEQFDRYHRIAKYIYNNYSNKISLQDIAEQEFLSTQYLSHEIKYALGYSFTDLLNLIRVEESAKLLLDTDKNILEISEEVGFSHTRYYNKHFKIHYKITPIQFRKRYKVNEEIFEKQKRLIIYDLKESFKYVSCYLQNYDRFNFENKIIKMNVNVDDEIGEMDKSFKEIINLGDAFDLLIEDNKDILKEIQEEISFNYGRILNVFSIDMGVFPSTQFYNWNRIKSVLEYLDYIRLKPLIVLDGKGYEKEEFINAIKNFAEYFMDIESIDINSFKFQFNSDMDKELVNDIRRILLEEYNLEVCEEYFYISNNIDSIYDTAYMLPFIINNFVNRTGEMNPLKAFDVLERQANPTNEVFFGYPGLVNDMGIKKPSYYAYYLLSKLGDKIICKGDGYIVTKCENGNEYAILLYNYDEELDKLLSFDDFSKLRGLKNTIGKRVSLNIINIFSDVRLTMYELNERVGSSYNYWIGMGKPIRLNREEKEILYKASFPKVDFKYYKKSTVLNLVTEIKDYGASLIIIKKILKHPK